jgi:hypothetical protein
MGRHARLVYQAREKTPGVPHHAKAGNINSSLLTSSAATGDFVLVLDCDMIVHPEFLQRTLGHFYTQASDSLGPAEDWPKSGPQWVLKPKAAFLQVPQDFWNVEAADPLGHCARFFYGPMLQVGSSPVPIARRHLRCVLMCAGGCCRGLMVPCIPLNCACTGEEARLSSTAFAMPPVIARTASQVTTHGTTQACLLCKCRAVTASVLLPAAAPVSSSGATS